MKGYASFELHLLDYLAFGAYFLGLCLIGYWFGRKKQRDSADYFLAGRTLPWYVVGSSFIASNISSEHFIAMIGAAFIYGIAPAMFEWANVATFTLLIWFFIPFLLAARVFSTPEFLERRFNATVRQFFAYVTVISNVVAFLAAVLYGGGLALNQLFGWDLRLAVVILALVSGGWAVYGGLRSVAWMDVLTVIIMIAGGLMVTILGLDMLSGDAHSLIEGFRVMLERNQAHDGVWAQVVRQNAPHIVQASHYNRLSVIQPVTHELTPWPGLIMMIFSVSIWYNVINQFMIQRVLGAKDMYHARMGIVLAGYMKIILPAIVVLPGLILFARYPEVMKLPWDQIRPQADKGYITMLQSIVPVGLRGLFLAALFGAIQSTVSAVLNSTSTIVTVDIYQRTLHRGASEGQLVRVGRLSSVVVMVIAAVLGMFIGRLGGSLFLYIQSLYAFFAPPFAAVFLLGILSRRINGPGATLAVILGFILGILLKMYVQFVPAHPAWLEPFQMQAALNWAICMLVCTGISLVTGRPDPSQVTDELTINWRKLNIFGQLGTHWYTSVCLWWGLFVAIIAALVLVFSGLLW
ncbi:MAG: sodium/solute symporter [Planctomycetes bacterium]|nr:sodium/solute symporter [Planctomycetota bacterium]